MDVSWMELYGRFSGDEDTNKYIGFSSPAFFLQRAIVNRFSTIFAGSMQQLIAWGSLL